MAIVLPSEPFFLPHPLRLYQQSRHEGAYRTLRVFTGTRLGSKPCRVVLQEYFDGSAAAILLVQSPQGRSLVGGILKAWSHLEVSPDSTIEEHYSPVHREFLQEVKRFCLAEQAVLVPEPQTSPLERSLSEDEAASATAATGRLLTGPTVSEEAARLVQSDCRRALSHWAESAFLDEDNHELHRLTAWLHAGVASGGPTALPGDMAPWPVAILLLMVSQASQDGLLDAVGGFSRGQTAAGACQAFFSPVAPSVLTEAQRSISGYLARQRHWRALAGKDVRDYPLDVSLLDIAVRELSWCADAIRAWLANPESLEQRARLGTP